MFFASNLTRQCITAILGNVLMELSCFEKKPCSHFWRKQQSICNINWKVNCPGHLHSCSVNDHLGIKWLVWSTRIQWSIKITASRIPPNLSVRAATVRVQHGTSSDKCWAWSGQENTRGWVSQKQCSEDWLHWGIQFTSTWILKSILLLTKNCFFSEFCLSFVTAKVNNNIPIF